MVAILQVLTIAGSQGDVYLLGEAYAFGVVWSFFMKGVGVLALRFQRSDQEYKTPLNPRIGGREIPLGLGIIVSALFLVAIANLFSKKIATIYGLTFTVLLLALFLISEYVNRRKRSGAEKGLENFNLDDQPQISASNLHARPGCILVAVRGEQLEHLRRTLRKTNLRRHDIVVMTVRPMSTGAGEYDLRTER